MWCSRHPLCPEFPPSAWRATPCPVPRQVFGAAPRTCSPFLPCAYKASLQVRKLRHRAWRELLRSCLGSPEGPLGSSMCVSPVRWCPGRCRANEMETRRVWVPTVVGSILATVSLGHKSGPLGQWRRRCPGGARGRPGGPARQAGGLRDAQAVLCRSGMHICTQ